MATLFPFRMSRNGNPRLHNNNNKLVCLFVFLGGMITGGWFHHAVVWMPPQASLLRNEKTFSTSRFQQTSLANVPFRNTSHVDKFGNPIQKQQLLEPWVVPNFVGYSIATLAESQSVAIHVHQDLYEMFYVLQGSGVAQVGRSLQEIKQYQLAPGDFLLVPPGVHHGFSARDDLMKMAVFGVVDRRI